MQWNQKLWRRSLDQFADFLEPLVAELGRSERREGAALYVQGLLMPGERKSIGPMAARLQTDSQKLQQFLADSPWDEQDVWRAIRRKVVPVLEPLAAWIIDETGWLKQGNKSVGVAHQYCGVVGKQANCQKLQQFLADSPWDEQDVWRAIRRKVVPVLEPLAAWIIDETGWLKQGNKSVGVAHQYCGAVGKQANCQVSVEVVVSDGEIAAPVAGQLYLPESWTRDQARCQAAGVPPGVSFQTKPAIALELVKQILADGVSPAPVLGDEVYGAASELRRGLRQLGLEDFLNTGSDLLAWTHPVKTRLAKKYWGIAEGEPEARSLAVLSQTITAAQWHPVAWRAADGTKRQTRVAWLVVYVLSDLDRDTGEWPPTWLVVDWPAGDADPYHLYLAWFKTPPTPQRCLRLSRGRF